MAIIRDCFPRLLEPSQPAKESMSALGPLGGWHVRVQYLLVANNRAIPRNFTADCVILTSLGERRAAVYIGARKIAA